MNQIICPCGSQKNYQDCCQPLHLREVKASNCEQLMRSRFSAFCLQLGDYLFDTYHPDFRGTLTAAQLAEPTLQWTSLEILDTKTLAKTGFVEFKAWFKDNGQLSYHHERSNFVKDHEQWLYCDGTFYPVQKSGKIQRNANCPCGSGKKYKKCCALTN